MTIPGIDMVVAVGMMAAIGRIDRSAVPEKLVAYLGLNPSVRQSGDGRAHHGRITKRGSSRARHLLVEAAWQTVRSPGPMRASTNACAPGAAPTSPRWRSPASSRC
jgi:transposase